MNETIFSSDNQRKIMEINNEGRITYIGKLWHSDDCGASDEIRVGPNGREVIKSSCRPPRILTAMYP